MINGEMRLVRHASIPEDPGFREQWNQLVQAMECPEVFYTWEWTQAVVHGWGPSLKPMLFAAYRGETLAGMVALPPLLHERGRD